MFFRRILRSSEKLFIRRMCVTTGKQNEINTGVKLNLQGVNLILGILSGGVGLASAIYYMAFMFFSVNELKVQMSKMDERIGNETKALVERTDAMNQRTDMMYNTFLEESRQHQKEMKERDERFYALLASFDNK